MSNTGAVPIALIEGDGIGPEITAAAARVVESTGVPVDWRPCEAGAASRRRTGTVVPESTLDAIRTAAAALKGPFYTPSGGDERSGNYYVRHGLDLYACLRPLRFVDTGHIVWLVRENVEDLYGAVEWMAAPGVAHAVKVATWAGCERIARYAFDLARRITPHVTVVHKANNLKLTEGMFLEVAREVAKDYPEVRTDDLLADTAAATLVSAPTGLDVVLTSNTFGDILSNVGGALCGSLGGVPTLNVGAGVVVAEASHGSADGLRGTGRANPLGLIDASALLLEFLGYTAAASAILDATQIVRKRGPRTPDMGGEATTAQVTDGVCALVAARGHQVTAAGPAPAQETGSPG